MYERESDFLAADRDNQYLMIDSTIVRAHRQAASGKGGKGSGVETFPRRTDDHDPYAGQPAGSSGKSHRHIWTGW